MDEQDLAALALVLLGIGVTSALVCVVFVAATMAGPDRQETLSGLVASCVVAGAVLASSAVVARRAGRTTLPSDRGPP